MNDWLVYLLRCADGTLYCGATNDIERRLKQHNSGKASKYTRYRLPVTIAATSDYMDRSSALKLEHKVKKQGNHTDKMTVIKTTEAKKKINLPTR